MISVRQRSADFFVRYAIVEADRQGVTQAFKGRVRYYSFYKVGLGLP